MQGRGYDTVYDLDMNKIFAGSTGEVLKWVVDHETLSKSNIHICIGETMKMVAWLDYVIWAGGPRKNPSDEKYAAVMTYVMSAMQAQAASTYYSDDVGGLDVVAKQTADKIVRLFS